MLQETKITKGEAVFTTGAFLRAFEVEINGVKSWRWIVVGQEGDAFANGKPIEVYDYADSFDKLFVEEGDDNRENENE